MTPAEVIAALSLPPLTEGVRAACTPTFHPPCVITVRPGHLDVHTPIRWLSSWPATPIAHEHVETRATIDLTAAHTWTQPPESREGRDGMPVRLELKDRRFDLWFSEDADTPAGAVVIAMIQLARAECRWIATCDRLDEVLRYCGSS